jgi:uncharacterized phage protein gp47/JayE
VATQFPKPTEIETSYFTTLKSIKPTFNPNDRNSDFVIRGRAISGVVSGVYGDQKKVNNDTWINSARPEALTKHGADLDIPQQPAVKANGPQIRATGTVGAAIPVGASLRYVPTGALYTVTTGGVIGGGGSGDFVVEANAAGQIGNVAFPDDLEFISPPTGINAVAALVQNISDGSDAESVDSYRRRLLDRMQQPPSGGNVTDYPTFAFAASPSVRSARVIRFGRGLGTVDVYITTGTTDVDAAVTQGLAIVRVPSPTVIAAVQTYYEEHVPYTDCPQVYGPTEVPVDVTIGVIPAAGLTLASVPADPDFNPLGLTVGELVQREVERVLWKNPVGGRVLPGSAGGFLVASDIEENVDVWLSGVPDPVSGALPGKIPCISDRQVKPLFGLLYDLPLLGNELTMPGTITVVEGVD